jgi:hypothetical protein
MSCRATSKDNWTSRHGRNGARVGVCADQAADSKPFEADGESLPIWMQRAPARKLDRSTLESLQDFEHGAVLVVEEPTGA